MISIYRLTLPVAPLEKAVTFYRQVLERDGKRISPTRHYFDCGGTVLVVCDFTVEGFGPKPGWKPFENQYVYFAVSDLEGTLRRVQKAGGTLRDGGSGIGIHKMPWGERLFYAVDPFGNALCFVDEKTIYVAG